MQRIAIIDIGSNSARLVISHIYKNGAYNMVYNQKEALRLSQKVDEKNMLTEVAFSSTIETMKSFAYMCKIYQADKTIAVATAAIRNAANGAELVARVAEETGIQLHIISGNTEAYISYLGVINTLNVKDGIIFDLGGGSTELILFKNRKILESVSLPIGAVNTIVRRPDGTLWGGNTDAYGFSMLVQSSGAEVRGKKALVFGSGGASATAQYVLRQMGAREVVVISRHGEDNYENLGRHTDAEIAVNATPVGMYPNTGVSPVDLSRFPALEVALDMVYNPARTEFLLQAEQLGLKRANGLLMLTAQAKKSCEAFLGTPIADERIAAITKSLAAQMQNVVLIGMPGSGKTTIGTRLAAQLGRTFLDADTVLEQKAGMNIPEIFRLEGEDGFRQRETAVLAELGKRSGLVIATGVCCVTRAENYPLLHQNGTIFCLTRDLSRLPISGRPVSQALGAEELYRRRKPLYEKFADAMIDNDRTVEDAVRQILEVLG